MNASSMRTLVLAPRGRDSELAVQLLARHDVQAEICDSGDDLLAAIGQGAGCAILTEEALEPTMQRRLAQQLEEQPPWSDFPLIVLASMQAAHHLQLMASALGNVTVIERPIAPQTLITAVRAALRGRRRQYETGREIRQRDEFLAMLGHELRTPLGAIVLATELARSGHDGAQRDNRLALIARQSKLLARLVDDLLDVSRVTTGKLVLRPETIAVDAVLAACVDSLAERARSRGVDLMIERTSGATIHADPVRLEQVVNNLLSNAIKYSPAGRSVHVSSVVRDDSCEIHVKDKGIGIAPEMQGHVFDLFAQVDASLSRAEGGMGVGLTLVDRIVALHGGTVALDSKGLGQGTELVVSLPMAQPDHASVAPIAPARKSTEVHVALVEDNEDLRELTASLLEAHGCAVDVAADGPDGIDLIVAKQPDLALVDIGLPTLDGFQVARQVRQKLGSSVVLVAITGYGREQDRENASQAGFDAFFTKPLSIDSVREILDRARGSRRASG